MLLNFFTQMAVVLKFYAAETGSILQTHHVDFTWNPRGVFVGYLFLTGFCVWREYNEKFDFV